MLYSIHFIRQNVLKLIYRMVHKSRHTGHLRLQSYINVEGGRSKRVIMHVLIKISVRADMNSN
jgi:hypothetical protein